MKTSDVLNKAADLIEGRGWTIGEGWPGTPGREEQTLCLEGGIMAALGMEQPQQWALTTCDAYRAVRDYLDWQPKIGQTFLFQWNDAQTDATVVIATLRATALIEAAREAEARILGEHPEADDAPTSSAVEYRAHLEPALAVGGDAA